MEAVAHDAFICLFMFSAQVYQGNVLNIQVISLFNQFSVCFVSGKAFLKAFAQFLVQLVQLQEYTDIPCIQGKGFFHFFLRSDGILLLIIVNQGQVSVYRREIGIRLCRGFPECTGFLPLQFIIK